MLNLDLISKKIIEKRKQKGMTQNELADTLFVSRQAVSKWEMGKSLPSIEVLLEMTELFDVTIDYILDGSELSDHDYQSMFMQYPRESVIYHFLNSNHLNEDIKNIFYLLTPKERKLMVDQFIAKQLCVDVTILWPYLSVVERKYLIGNFKSKDMDQELLNLYDLMSREEKMMVNPEGRSTITYVSKKRKGEKS
ncbi:MAG: helix-turn-helix domain-containing protein [Firmicutes bacterium]|nr:helix-turn-helix domain-containing protein [Bacillota bacterium]